MKVKIIATGSPGTKIFISPIYFILKSYYNLRVNNKNKVEWGETIYDRNKSVQEIFDNIQNEKIDVLCLSIFIWNRAQLTHLAKMIKEKMPNVIIIAGGPDLDAHRNPTFFDNNNMFDYVVYGDGEEAFVTLLDSIIEKKELINAYNIVTPSKIFPFRIFQDDEFSKISPWLDLQKEVAETINFFGKDNSVIYWEMARGCPYSCSFCDWNNSLHNKVKRRRSNWKEEIDFFSELGAEVRVIDANWGMYKEDIEIHKYALPKLQFTAMNLPKLNKKTAYELMSLSYQYFPEGRFVISLQDLNEDVLKNIDRPSPPWGEHKKLIKELQQKHPDLELRAELIIGLPGQTIDTWIDTLLELENIGINYLEANLWMMLPGSPAYKADYQKKHQIKFDEIIFIKKDFKSYDEINFAVKNGLQGWYKTRMITSSISADFSDILTMFALASVYNFLHAYYKKIKFVDLVDKLRNRLKEECNEFAKIIDNTKTFSVQVDDKLVSLEEYYYEFAKIKTLLR